VDLDRLSRLHNRISKIQQHKEAGLLPWRAMMRSTVHKMRLRGSVQNK